MDSNLYHFFVEEYTFTTVWVPSCLTGSTPELGMDSNPYNVFAKEYTITAIWVPLYLTGSMPGASTWYGLESMLYSGMEPVK